MIDEARKFEIRDEIIRLRNTNRMASLISYIKGLPFDEEIYAQEVIDELERYSNRHEKLDKVVEMQESIKHREMILDQVGEPRGQSILKFIGLQPSIGASAMAAGTLGNVFEALRGSTDLFAKLQSDQYRWLDSIFLDSVNASRELREAAEKVQRTGIDPVTHRFLEPFTVEKQFVEKTLMDGRKKKAQTKPAGLSESLRKKILEGIDNGYNTDPVLEQYSKEAFNKIVQARARRNIELGLDIAGGADNLRNLVDEHMKRREAGNDR